MDKETYTQPHNMDEFEVAEWLESLDSVLAASGEDVAREILERLRAHAKVAGINLPFTANTPYANTVPARLEPEFPGDQAIERRIKSLIRWNALAMVVRANRVEHNIGGHISTYASAATLYEVGFNHFFRARNENFEGDTVYFQGHASPGIYARAFLDGTADPSTWRTLFPVLCTLFAETLFRTPGEVLLQVEGFVQSLAN